MNPNYAALVRGELPVQPTKATAEAMAVVTSAVCEFCDYVMTGRDLVENGPQWYHLLAIVPFVPGTLGRIVRGAGDEVAEVATSGVKGVAKADEAKALRQVDTVVGTPQYRTGLGDTDFTYPNINDGSYLTENNVLSVAEDWLGPNYKEIGKPGSGVFSAQYDDLERRFRMTTSDLTGAHGVQGPHVHFEVWRGSDVVVNQHVTLYPE